MAWVVRAVIALWGLAFTALAVRGIIDPTTFADQFGVTAEDSAVNSLRADFGAFFLIAGLCALWGAARPAQAKALWVPAALFGAAFVIRAIGLAMGDAAAPSITQAMTVEAVSVLLLLASAYYLGRNS